MYFYLNYILLVTIRSFTNIDFTLKTHAHLLKNLTYCYKVLKISQTLNVLNAAYRFMRQEKIPNKNEVLCIISAFHTVI